MPLGETENQSAKNSEKEMTAAIEENLGSNDYTRSLESSGQGVLSGMRHGLSNIAVGIELPEIKQERADRLLDAFKELANGIFTTTGHMDNQTIERIEVALRGAAALMKDTSSQSTHDAQRMIELLKQRHQKNL